MTPEEITDMLSRIGEGKLFPYVMKDNSGDQLRLSVATDGFAMRTSGDFFDLTDPNQALLLAGILVKWANVRLGRTLDAEEADAYTRLFGIEAEKPEQHPVNNLRAKWYERNVKLMTLETMMRNYNDLKAIQEDIQNRSISPEEVNDIRLALGLLWTHMRAKDARVEFCNKCYRVFLNDHICRGDW